VPHNIAESVGSLYPSIFEELLPPAAPSAVLEAAHNILMG
jgi:hypothetical protein